MKKISIIRLFAASATVLAVLSCQKEIESAVPAGSENLVSIRVGMPEDTKVAFDGETEGLLATSWEAGDKLTIVGTTTEVFTLTEGAGTKQGVFTGNAVEGDSFTVICSGASASAEEFGNVSYLDQVQDGNGDTGHLRFGATLSGVSDYSAIEFSPEWAAQNNATLSQNAVFKFYLKLPAAVTEVTGVRLNCGTQQFSTKNSGSTVSELSLGLQNVDVSMSGNILTAYMMVSAKSVTPSGDWVVEVLTGAGATYVKSFTPATAALAGGKCHTIKLNDEGWYFLSGHGTESAPWVLTTAADMQEIAPLLVFAADTERYTRYFEMGADIDMAGIHWTPLVTGNQTKPISFDGKDHKISNLTVDTAVSFPSFIGVFDGTIKNVTFDKADIKNMKSSGQQTAVVAGWAGRNSGDITATMQKVIVNDSKVYNVTATAGTHATGLFAGQANGITAKGCEATGTNTVEGGINGSDSRVGGFVGLVDAGTICATPNTFTDCSCNATVTGYGRVGGGFAGGIRIPVTMTRCSFVGKVSAPGGGQFGGLAGALKSKAAASAFTGCNCQVELTTAASSGNHSGLIGYIEVNNVVVSACSTKGSVTSPCSNSAGTSGLVGGIKATGTKITGCSSICNITGTGSNGAIGGIVGYLDAAATGTVVEKCSFKGDIKTGTGSNNGASQIGGIVGDCRTTASGGLLIENCCSAGSIRQCNYGIGGIIGNTMEYQVIRNCYSTMSLESRHGVGGIVGRADKNANAVGETYNVTVDKCIFWGEISNRMGATASNLSSGAIVGKSAKKNIYSNCYRKAGMTFVAYSDSQYNALFDMPDTDSSHALDYSASTADPQSLGQYYWPYHGKAAGASETISDVAVRLGWSESVWSFEHDEPELL